VDCGLRLALAKVNETPISTNKLGLVIDACSPSYCRVLGRRIVI
jgi:hypothetical protein